MAQSEVVRCFKPPNLRRMGQRRWSLTLPLRPMSRIVLSCLILGSPNVGYRLPAFLCSPWVVILPFLCLHHRGPSEDLGPELSLGSVAQPALVSVQSFRASVLSGYTNRPCHSPPNCHSSGGRNNFTTNYFVLRGGQKEKRSREGWGMAEGDCLSLLRLLL